MADETRADYQQLDEIAARFRNQGEAIQQMRGSLQQSMDQLRDGWIGEGSDAFFAEMRADSMPAVLRLEAALETASETTLAISRLMRAAEEEAAALFRDYFSGTGGQPGGQADMGLHDHGHEQVGGGGGGLSQDIRDRWASLTPAQQAAALQSMADEIAREYGIDSVPVTVQQLVDPPNGDLRGYRNDQGIFIDIDNMNDPNVVLNTIAHEVRHEIQHEMAEQLNPPSAWESFLRTIGLSSAPTWPQHGVTEAEAQAWRDNFDNYITFESDPEGYRNQPLETDARAFGENYLNNLTLEALERHIPPLQPVAVPHPTPGPTPVPSATPTPTPGA